MFSVLKPRPSRRRNARVVPVQNLEPRLALTGTAMMPDLAMNEAMSDMMPTDAPMVAEAMATETNDGSMMASDMETTDAMAMANMMMAMGDSEAMTPANSNEVTPLTRPNVELFEQPSPTVSGRVDQPPVGIASAANEQFELAPRSVGPVNDAAFKDSPFGFELDPEESLKPHVDESDPNSNDPSDMMAEQKSSIAEEAADTPEVMPTKSKESDLMPPAVPAPTVTAKPIEQPETDQSRTAESDQTESEAVDVASIDLIFGAESEVSDRALNQHAEALGGVLGIVVAGQLRSPRTKRGARKQRRATR